MQIYIAHRRKNFHKFWWNEELRSLKEASVESNQMWKAAGKPRQGPIFTKHQSCRSAACNIANVLEKNKNLAPLHTPIHEALLDKDGSTFWKCWRSKFEFDSKCTEVEGCVDSSIIADKFADHFRNTFNYNNVDRMQALKDEYSNVRENYYGLPISDINPFDTEFVSKVIADLKNGRAADIAGLTSEHLQFNHPLLPVVSVSYTHLTLPTILRV